MAGVAVLVVTEQRAVPIPVCELIVVSPLPIKDVDTRCPAAFPDLDDRGLSSSRFSGGVMWYLL